MWTDGVVFSSFVDAGPSPVSGRAKKNPREIKGADGAVMVLVPAGWFFMGADDGDEDQKPRRRVYLDAYYIDKYPVTNARFGEPEEDYGPRFTGEKSPVDLPSQNR